jgi:hypothetical protein
MLASSAFPTHQPATRIDLMEQILARHGEADLASAIVT